MTKTRQLRGDTLPRPVTTFVGRRQETASVRRALGVSRLLTLTGPGGVGKTRLALHVAAAVRRTFEDGTHFVDLAKIDDPALVVHAVADALELRDQSSKTPADALAAYLSDKHLLLVLDNCEHVLETSARVTSSVLASAPDVRVLATSREPLNIAGEHVWPVPPLSVPTESEWSTVFAGGAVSQFEAVALFVDRASAVVPDFVLTPANQHTVARLCARLDGLPLAIELAAVRLRALSPRQMLDRLERAFEFLTEGNRTAPERHQTLQAAIAWSFGLCSESERHVWTRCSVFAGDFDLDAAEFICADELVDERDIFTGIAGLVDKSILARIESGTLVRYRMLATIRQFGLQRLAETRSASTVRRRHRDYYLDMAERSDAESCTAEQLVWAERLPADRANLFAALDYCLNTPGETRAGLRMGASLWFYWIACGSVRDGRHWLDRILAADGAISSERARALWVDGWVTILQGENDAGVERLTDCLRIATTLNDDTAAAYATQLLGLAKIFGNDPLGAAPLLDSSLATHRFSDWTAPALISFPQRGLAAVMVGEPEVAVALAQECRELCRQRGERWVLSWVTFVLALARWVAGDITATIQQSREAYRQKSELGDHLGTPFCIEMLAWASVTVGDHNRAATLFGSADELWERIGTPLFGYEALLLWSRENRDLAGKALGPAIYEECRRKGALMTPEETSRLVWGEPMRSSPRGPDVTRAIDAALTKREREVAALVAEGLSNHDIAGHLVISGRTAEAHVEHILTKLGFSSRAQIATWVAEADRGDVVPRA